VSVAIEKDFVVRWGESYEIQLRDWIDKAFQGNSAGSSAWDGYTAALTADALVASQKSHSPEKVVFSEKPDIYRK
jgi:myo-inositol 2-dehydrogenase/D-chiro-inositol 1-dehydrogenase